MPRAVLIGRLTTSAMSRALEVTERTAESVATLRLRHLAEPSERIDLADSVAQQDLAPDLPRAVVRFQAVVVHQTVVHHLVCDKVVLTLEPTRRNGFAGAQES